MKNVFEFEFVTTDTAGADLYITKQIEFFGLTAAQADELEEMYNTDEFEEIQTTLEDEYGIHDAFSGTDYIANTRTIFGFHSYEVEEGKIDELMEKWRNFFVGLSEQSNGFPKFTVGEIVETHRGNDEA